MQVNTETTVSLPSLCNAQMLLHPSTTKLNMTAMSTKGLTVFFKANWQIGSRCRAVFTEDGQNYEAIITSLNLEQGTCMVRYLGYGNTEEQQLQDLHKMDSHGSRRHTDVPSSNASVASGVSDLKLLDFRPYPAIATHNFMQFMRGSNISDAACATVNVMTFACLLLHLRFACCHGDAFLRMCL